MAGTGKVLEAIGELLKRGYSAQEVFFKTGYKKMPDGEWLDMEKAAREQRAAEQGYIPTYHGSPTDIPESGFRMDGTAESDMGAGIYSTTNPYDASYNYADPETSQDLQGKIQRLAEGISDEQGIDYDNALGVVKAQLVTNPSVSPVMVRAQKPVRIGGRNETYFDMEMKYDTDETMDEAKEAINEEYADEIAEGYYDKEELDELYMERAQEIAEEYGYVDESGPMLDLVEGMRNVSHRFDDLDVEQAIQDLMENHPDGAGAEEIIDTLKGSEGVQYAMSGDTGELSSGEFIRQAFEDAGYDSIIDATPNKKWGSQSGRSTYMPELEGTEHVIAFSPSQMRSKFAAFDPRNMESSNLLAGIGGLGVGVGALSPQDALAGQRPTSTGTIEAAKAPYMEALANALRSVDTPIGKPFENLADWAHGVAYQDDDKLSRAAWGALDIAP